MKMMAVPRSRRSRFRSSRICASSVTSSADVASSAISSGRLEQQRHRDHDPLPHAAGELVRVVVDAVGGVRDADELEHLDRAPPQVPLAALPARRCAFWASTSCAPIENVGLRLVSGSWKIIAMPRPRSSRRASPRRRKHILLAQPTLTGRHLAVRGQQPHERCRQRRLAAARLADDAHDLAGPHLEADVAERHERPRAGVVDDLESVD